MMKFRSALLAVVTLLSLTPAQAAEIVHIGVAYDTGGIGDQSFNDAVASGIAQAQKSAEFVVDATVTDGSAKNREARVRSLIAKNADPIIAVGSGYASVIAKLSREYPDRKFALMNDRSVEGPFVTSIVFGEVEGAYLAGVAAAHASKSGKVAMIALANQSALYEKGFAMGVTAAKKGVKSNIDYFSGNLAVATSRALATGADVIFISVPGSLTDAFREIVRSKNAGLISMSPDQYLTVTPRTKKYLYATVIKRVDLAMKEWTLTSIKGEQLLDFIDEQNGIYGRFYGIENNGVEIALLSPSLAAASSSINRIAAAAAKIHA